MKIAKSRLRELIQEELHAAGLGDLQSDEKFTGGSPEERLLTLMKAREVLAAMSKEDLTALSKSLDAEQVAVLRHILANPMYKEGDEMELEEYRGGADAAQSRKRMQNYRGGSNRSPYGSSR